MARAKKAQPAASADPARRTRTSAAWLSITIFVGFVVLLIVFIAENNRRVPLHFLGGSWRVSESVALVAAALGGALLVIVIGTARILQLRLAARRARREVKRKNKAAASAPAAPMPAAAGSAAVGSALPESGPPAQGEAQPVETESQA